MNALWFILRVIEVLLVTAGIYGLGYLKGVDKTFWKLLKYCKFDDESEDENK